MHIVIVAGPMCAGKSTYIQKNFPNHTVIDLYAFQDGMDFPTYETVMKSYEECRDALIEAIKRGEDVVLEHTLLKQKRRPMYIDAIRSVTDADIEMHWLQPSIDTLAHRALERKMRINLKYCREFAEAVLESAETPTVDEGFSVVKIIAE